MMLDWKETVERYEKTNAKEKEYRRFVQRIQRAMARIRRKLKILASREKGKVLFKVLERLLQPLQELKRPLRGRVGECAV